VDWQSDAGLFALCLRFVFAPRNFHKTTDSFCVCVCVCVVFGHLQLHSWTDRCIHNSEALFALLSRAAKHSLVCGGVAWDKYLPILFNHYLQVSFTISLPLLFIADGAVCDFSCWT
jgi:hypothetical protein